MLLKDGIAQKLLDSRVLEKNLERGYVSLKHYQDFLKTLPDDSANVHYVSLDDLSKEDDGVQNGIDGAYYSY